MGVNGAGKTTTIGKLASQFRAAGKSVVIAAGDTFRAAAVEQLQEWGRRAGCPVVSQGAGADPWTGQGAQGGGWDTPSAGEPKF